MEHQARKEDRARKAAELENLIVMHGQAGGGITFGTFTSGEHHTADSLESSLMVLRKSWARLIHCNRWEKVKARHQFMGLVLAYEFTYGLEHGWNPHLHALWFHREPLDARGLVDVDTHMRERWSIGIGQAGRYLHPTAGAQVVMNAAGTALGGYVAKVQESDWGVAQEMARGDVKGARRAGSRVPFAILADHYQDGDLADWRLWAEYARAITVGGKRSLPLARMTPGLRRQVLGSAAQPVLSDEQLAVVEVGGELIAVIAWRVWVKVRQAGIGPDLLAAAERGGLAAINDLLGARGFGCADRCRSRTGVR